MTGLGWESAFNVAAAIRRRELSAAEVLEEDLLAVLDSGPAQEYLAILDRRDRLIASWDRFFAGCDVFLAPAMPMRAWRAEEDPADDSPEMQVFLAAELSQASGCPMVVMPAGLDRNGVPFGVQLVGPRWADERR